MSNYDPKIPRDLKREAKAAKMLGWRIERAGCNHLRWLSPDRSIEPVFTSSTPGGANRSVQNSKAKLKRAGLVPA